MQPSATTASTPRVSAIVRAASGSSNEPGTHSMGTSGAPLAVKHSIAPSTRRSVISWLKRAATMAKCNPDASSGVSGGFIRPDNGLSSGDDIFEIEIVAQLLLLRSEIGDVVLRRSRLQRNAFDDSET